MAISPKEVKKLKEADTETVELLEHEIDEHIRIRALGNGGSITQGEKFRIQWGGLTSLRAGENEQRELRRKYLRAGWKDVQVADDEIWLTMPRYRGARRAPTD